MCDQHRENWRDPLVLYYRATNTENWRFLSELYIIMLLCDQHRKLACPFWVLTYTIVRLTQETDLPFLFSSIARRTQILSFSSSYYCAINRKLAGPFWCDFYTTVLSTQSPDVFYLRLYYCATNTESWRAFLVLMYTVVRPTQKTGVHSLC